jgi:hypothetical protein
MSAHPVSVAGCTPAQHLVHGSAGPGWLMLAASDLGLEKLHQPTHTLRMPFTKPVKELQGNLVSYL